MKSLIRRITGQGRSPVPYASPGRAIMPLFAGQTDNEIYMRAYGTSGTIFSIVTTLATAVSTPAWHLYRKQPVDGRRRYTTGDKGSDQRTEVVNHAALSLWNSPNDFIITSEFVHASIQHLELTGECWWVLDRSNASFPTSMWLVRPDRMEPVPSPDSYLQGYLYHSPDGTKIPLDTDDVIFTKYPNPLDPYRGLGPVAAILVNVDSLRYANEFNRNFFLNNAVPGGVIQVDKRLSDSEWDELTNRWRESHQGVSRAHRVAVLESGAVWVPNALTQKDMDFANLITQERDILREAWGIHKSMLGNADDVNRANAQTAEEVFGSWKIIPRLNLIRNALNYRLLPQFGSTGQGVEFDYENPLPQNREVDNEELQAKSAAAQVLITAGFDPAAVLETVGLPDMAVAERATQSPALPPGWVAAPPPGTPAPPAAPELPANRVLAKKDPRAKVYQQLAKDFPPDAMSWVSHADWSGPTRVPLDHIDTSGMSAWNTDPANVAHFREEIEQRGKAKKPVILIKTPGNDLLCVSDGHTRVTAYKQMNIPVNAYIGTVNADHGPWEDMHKLQYEGSQFAQWEAFLGINGKGVLNGSR